ncbi:MAG TPA: hypothetical protein VN812_07610 [Candidatus Acidoferrales bacterium]|nr:hypothetical protein [Candidatus Acidoferrales bacterium]
MATINVGSTVSSQLNAGASILAAARTIDTRLVKGRLAAFERAQRTYSAAHDKVSAAEAALDAATTRLGELDADQDDAVDALARALIAEGQPRSNPFRDFSPLAPGRLMAQRNGDGAKAVHQLVTAVQRAKGITKPTLQAAQAAERAARALEQQLAQIEKLHETVSEVRHTRDAVAQGWLTELAAFKRGARAAADEGAPHLYATLFDRPARTNGRSAKPAPEPPPAPTPPAPAAQVEPVPQAPAAQPPSAAS